jgi:uncharacterized repeat protein (TIGR01451 family)
MVRTARFSRATRACIGLAASILLVANGLAGVVTSTLDAGAGSLRDTLAAAASGDTITFSLTLPATIALTSELPITKSVTIQGPGAGSLTISDTTGRVFNLDTAAKTVLITGVHLSGQNPSGDGGAIINNGGDLTLEYSLIDASSSPGEGGAIRNNFNGSTGYSLTIRNSTIDGNSANKSGAIYFLGFGLTIENSTIHNNHATDSSGAIGLFSGFGFIYNSTIVGNTANTVGGITSQDSQLTFESTIVANNTDPTGINDLNRTGGGNGSFVNATNSLFTENFVPGDNVLNGGTVVGNLVGVDPQLDPLTDNGGPIQTLRPGPLSPAIGAGVNLHGYLYDQRGPGFPRNADPAGAPGNVDIGAIQRFAPSLSANLTVALDDGHAYARYGQVRNYILTISNAGPSAASDIDITETLAAEFDGVFANWICFGGSGGASCTPSGSGPLIDSNVTIPEARSLTWLISAPIKFDAAGNTADNSIDVASLTDPNAPYDVTDSDILVIFRDGFDVAYGDGTGSVAPASGVQPAGSSTLTSSLRAGQMLTVNVPAVRAMVPIDTLLRARGSAGSGFRVEHLNLGTDPRVRLIAIDPTGFERPSAWVQTSPSASLVLVLGSGNTVVLETAKEKLTMALTGAANQTYRVDQAGASNVKQ